MSMKVNRLYCENCLDTMARMENDFINLTVTSPPYDDIRTYKCYSFDFEAVSSELFRVTKSGGVVVWIVNDQTVEGDETGTSFRQALHFKELGFKLFDTMIFAKSPRGISGGNYGYYPAFEYMFVFSKDRIKTRNFICDSKNSRFVKRKGQSKSQRNRDGSLSLRKRNRDTDTEDFSRRTNLWHYKLGYGQMNKQLWAHQHPAIFPDKLAHDHIWSWSNKNDIVYDPFAGSGTTLLMAKQLGRRYIGSEISREYYELALSRIEDEQQTIDLSDIEYVTYKNE